jgi:pyrrolysine biosynthesis protein PylD
MMTRLTNDLVKDIISSLDKADKMLMAITGMDLSELSHDAVGVRKNEITLSDLKVGVVPITSGLGIITQFSESVAEIIKRLGMDAFVTNTYDVTGFAEAISKGAEIVFMADDVEFVAFNVKAGKYTNNSYATAAGYATALKCAAGGLEGKEVLVLGAGRVGAFAVEIMTKMGAKVSVFDIDEKKVKELQKRFNVTSFSDVGEAISSHSLIFNASPAPVDGKYIKQQTTISSPGLPFGFDEEGIRKARIIHDPLNIGVAVMAMGSASFSRKNKGA